MVDGGIGLNDVFENPVVLDLNCAPERTDDSGCQCPFQPVGIADRQYLLSDLKRFRRSQRNWLQPIFRRIDLDDGQVIVRIVTDDRRRVLGLVRQGDFEPARTSITWKLVTMCPSRVDDGTGAGAGFHRNRPKEEVILQRGCCDVHDTGAVALIDVDVVSSRRRSRRLPPELLRRAGDDAQLTSGDRDVSGRSGLHSRMT